MRRRQIAVRADSRATPEVVFGLLADGASWPASFFPRTPGTGRLLERGLRRLQ
jgi:hypothetical protein